MFLKKFGTKINWIGLRSFYICKRNLMTTSEVSIEIRKSSERGYANHGWLDTFHTFSFADYHDKKYQGWGCLRVINEDRVGSGRGFGMHPHSNFEIFSYVVSGELDHTDSMNNEEKIHRGEVQFTSAGTGIYHSENNTNPEQKVHLLQIWVRPRVSGLKPSYTTMKFEDSQKKNNLLKILGPENSDKWIKINSDIHIYSSLLEEGNEVKYVWKGEKGYVHLIQNGGKIEINGQVLQEGDGAFITSKPGDEIIIKGLSKKSSEFILFDILP
eukprot:TRINITY_DN2761_c0_g3_i2.p1 TRINITY_DN2761_c0_g3~~TRINITY_DN2761_c0_g3_i2.p1  ORF type:complete len:270 (+),score=45.60 TRINITY_DN2761_c0_g3_i2:99-908(+)